MEFLYSKPFVEKIEKEILKKTRGMKTPPVLAIVLAGNDPASLSYVKRKELATKKYRALSCNCLCRKDSTRKKSFQASPSAKMWTICAATPLLSRQPYKRFGH